MEKYSFELGKRQGKKEVIDLACKFLELYVSIIRTDISYTERVVIKDFKKFIKDYEQGR